MHKKYLDCQRSDGDCRDVPANAIAYLRARRGMTQQQLADAAGINIRQIQKFEYGERDIGGASLRIVARVADALEIKDLRELL